MPGETNPGGERVPGNVWCQERTNGRRKCLKKECPRGGLVPGGPMPRESRFQGEKGCQKSEMSRRSVFQDIPSEREERAAGNVILRGK